MSLLDKLHEAEVGMDPSMPFDDQLQEFNIKIDYHRKMLEYFETQKAKLISQN